MHDELSGWRQSGTQARYGGADYRRIFLSVGEQRRRADDHEGQSFWTGGKNPNHRLCDPPRHPPARAVPDRLVSGLGGNQALVPPFFSFLSWQIPAHEIASPVIFIVASLSPYFCFGRENYR